MSLNSKNSPIAIIGDGAIGKALACDCILGGNTDVRLYGRHAFNGLTESEKGTRPLTIYGPQKNRAGYCREGRATPTLITENIAQAMDGARIVLVVLPSSAHDNIFQCMIPLLEDGQIIHIMPENYGTLRLRKLMKDAGCKKQVIVGGWNLPPFGARLKEKSGTGAYEVRMVNRFMQITGAAYPYRDQKNFIDSVQSVAAFDCVRQYGNIKDGDTILDATFSNLNTILHIPTTIMGVSVMENWGRIYGEAGTFSIFSHAMCPSIAKIQYLFYLEEVAVAQALGIEMSHFPESSFYNRESILADTYLAPGEESSFDDICANQIGIGPPSIQHRFITEDVPMAANMIHQLGQLSGTATPLIDAFITLAGALTDCNYFQSGSTLADVGLDGISAKNLRDYLMGN